MTNTQMAQLVMRIGLAINLFMHGLVRIPKLTVFVEKTAAGFAHTLLPDMLTRAFLYALPFVELLIGGLILVGGRFGQWGYLLGGLLMGVLLFGTSLKEDWNTAGTQLIYLIAFALALRGLDDNGRRRW